MAAVRAGTVSSAAATHAQLDVFAASGRPIRTRRRPRFNAGQVAHRGGDAEDLRSDINSDSGGTR